MTSYDDIWSSNEEFAVTPSKDELNKRLKIMEMTDTIHDLEETLLDATTNANITKENTHLLRRQLVKKKEKMKNKIKNLTRGNNCNKDNEIQILND